MSTINDSDPNDRRLATMSGCLQRASLTQHVTVVGGLKLQFKKGQLVAPGQAFLARRRGTVAPLRCEGKRES